jgi:zinc D-Ala-D-Ala dipeptidase
VKLLCGLCLFILATSLYALPPRFVYLHEQDPSILQDIRYAGSHNFVGRPLEGYTAKKCILTQAAALALSQVQKQLRSFSLTLKVYDCYRPLSAVNDLISWSEEQSQQGMKAEFYPRAAKADFFHLGYVAKRSGHSRGSTIDLTLVPLHVPSEPAYHPGQKLAACTAPLSMRYQDNSIDMGTGYDCLDAKASISNNHITKAAEQHRFLLRSIMIEHGFIPYDKEWWHFSLKNEPYPSQYFNFLIQ